MNKSEITFEDLQSRISNYIDKAHLYDSNIQFNFVVDGSVDNNKKFTSVEGMNIHRVVQEAIHNSLKYANASKINVDISKVVSNFVFRISDNGKGFDITKVKRGNGLNNMEKRIHNIGGEIVFNSSENKGTEVVVTI
jgi:signal transduction histidine kinase